jgi:hypothetical protein
MRVRGTRCEKTLAPAHAFGHDATGARVQSADADIFEIVAALTRPGPFPARAAAPASLEMALSA